jgi:putative Mg2+ transporter-C (MgtC) family protein
MDGGIMCAVSPPPPAWLTACLGAVCGLGDWHLLLGGLPVVFLVLVLGGPFERLVHHYWPGEEEPPAAD